MVRGEAVGRTGVLLEDDVIVTCVPSSADDEACEKTDWFSAASFVGEANRLSGRMCSKLLSCQMQRADNQEVKLRKMQNFEKIVHACSKNEVRNLHFHTNSREIHYWPRILYLSWRSESSAFALLLVEDSVRLDTNFSSAAPWQASYSALTKINGYLDEI